MISPVFTNLGPMAVPLLLCSTLCIAILIERSLICLFTRHKKATNLRDQILSEKLQFPSPLFNHLKTSKDLFIQAFLKVQNTTPQFRWNYLKRLSRQFHTRLGLLKTIVAVAPLLGILGTLFGLMTSFSGFKDTTQIAEPEVLLSGLSEAIGTTALGLIISVVALVIHNIFQAYAISQTQSLEAFFTQIEEVQFSQFIPDNVSQKTTGSKQNQKLVPTSPEVI